MPPKGRPKAVTNSARPASGTVAAFGKLPEPVEEKRDADDQEGEAEDHQEDRLPALVEAGDGGALPEEGFAGAEGDQGWFGAGLAGSATCDRPLRFRLQ